jgi:HSP20 family protein
MSNLSTIMDSFLDDVRPLVNRQVTLFGLPAVNVKEFGDKYEITMTIPGIDASKIKLEFIEKVLNISYTNEEDTQSNDGTMIREEYRTYSFARAITLAKNIDDNSVKASSKNGILTITVMKSAETHPKSINIEIH